MAWYKIILHRSNVNGKVKSRFAAHEDFLTTVGKGLFREFILHYFDMPEETSDISENFLPTNVHMLHKEKREKIFHQTMERILNKVLVRFWVGSTFMYMLKSTTCIFIGYVLYIQLSDDFT